MPSCNSGKTTSKMESNAPNATGAEVTFKDYDGPRKAFLEKFLCDYKDLVSILPAHTFMPSTYKEFHEKLQGFQSRKSDVWISSYPKAGTTWTQELVWCLLFTMSDPRGSDILTKRFPFFEWDSLFPPDFSFDHIPEDDPNNPGVMWKMLTETMPEPRTIKTHLHRALLPASVDQLMPKMVYVCRDPRDVCVSMYYHDISLVGYTGDFNGFVDLFLADIHPWSPYWSHVLSYWQRRHDPNVFFITFEELKKDLTGCLRRIALFLDVKRGDKSGVLDSKELSALEQHLSFASMSKNPATNNDSLKSAAVNPEIGKNVKFMRKGKVGDHKRHLSSEQLERFKTWTFNALNGVDFPYYKDYD